MHPRYRFAGLVGFLALILCMQDAVQQTNDTAAAQNQAAPPLKIATRVVVVRVVVRDAQGNPVEGLKKEDFKLFDRGKEQTITQFEVESAIAPPLNSAAAVAPGQASLPAAPAARGTFAVPARFLALYFDDLNTSFADMAAARDAAEHYVAADLHPQDRVAVFTTEAMLADFTSDAKLLHEALLELRVSPRSRTQDHDCPQLSDFQAQQIMENPNNQNLDAWKVANNELPVCDGGSQPQAMSSGAGSSGGMSSGNPAGSSPGGGGGSPSGGPGSSMPGTSGGSAIGGAGPPPGGFASNLILQRARTIVEQAEVQARANLQAIERVVTYASQMPGQRAVILVSSGFLSQSVQNQVDRLIDHALRLQVVVSALDPKGLAIFMREMDVTQAHAPSGDSVRAGHSLDSTAEMVTTGVLADVAEGTGGEFFHNKNDLNAGFGGLGGSPVSYILAFAPDDIKPDGKFHALKVTLNDKPKAVTIQARRGYFAPTSDAARPMEVKELIGAGTDSPVQEQIREMILSRTDSAQLPVQLNVNSSEAQNGMHELTLSSHLDVSSLPFQKVDGRNINTVIFFFAVFDKKDDLINVQMRRAKVNVADAQVPELFKAGLELSATFQLKPGSYRVREVVTESEENHTTAFSRDIAIP
jgi:VWFA-related protein